MALPPSKDKKGLETEKFDGIQAAVEILRNLDDISRQRMLKNLAEKDPVTTEKIKAELYKSRK